MQVLVNQQQKSQASSKGQAKTKVRKKSSTAVNLFRKLTLSLDCKHRLLEQPMSK